MTKSNKADNQPEAKRKHRSPNYPATSLKRALELAEIQYKEDRLHSIPIDLTCKRWGYKKDQGSLYLAAVKSFGLVEVDGAGSKRQVRVTDIVRRVLLGSDDSSDLLKRAALRPKVYSDIWNKYDGELPRNDVLSHYLIFELNFNEKSVAGFISNFRETISFAKLEKSDILSEQDGEEPERYYTDNEPKIHPPSETPKLKRPKMESGQFEEIRFALPSGKAAIFLPENMKPTEFEILQTIIDAHKRVREAVVQSETQSEENDEE